MTLNTLLRVERRLGNVGRLSAPRDPVEALFCRVEWPVLTSRLKPRGHYTPSDSR